MRVESDGWGPGPSILAPETLAQLRAALEETPLIIEHRFYRGSRAPDRLIFDDAEECERYLRTCTHPGDAIWIWRYDALCRSDNALANAKVPDTDGAVPARGPY
jgi:hypothetical protein